MTESRYAKKLVAAADALAEVLTDPALGKYQKRREALLEALRWLEDDSLCADCLEGRCHGRKRFYRCGCDRHDASVATRFRRARITAAEVTG